MCSLHQWDPRCPQTLSVTRLLGGAGLDLDPPQGSGGEGRGWFHKQVRHVAYSSTFWAKVNLVNQVLGSTSQTCKACACPASRLKKEPGVSKGVISGLMDGGAYMPEQGLGETPHRVRRTTGSTWQQSAPGGKGRLPVIGELTSGGFISHQRNQQRGLPLTTL